jgi:hypothetical protein
MSGAAGSSAMSQPLSRIESVSRDYNFGRRKRCCLAGKVPMPRALARRRDAMKDIIVGKAAYLGRFRQ